MSWISWLGEILGLFFECLRINADFLRVPVCDWDENESFKAGRMIVRNLRVVNDSAERGVKLTSDFLKTAKSEDRLQNILQVVENSRFTNPDQRKKSKNGSSWFLYV